MKFTRSIPRNVRMPSLRNVVMVDTCRGVLRVRKWPKKRGTPKSALQRWWNDWFRQANLLAKYADGLTQARAIEMTKGSGLYPRDVILKAMRGRLYIWADETGWKWYPVAAIQDISDSLDVLAQTVGSILVRATDRWRGVDVSGASIGEVLTYQGTAAPPVWASAGAGVSQQVVAGTPIVPDGTKSIYVLDVTSYAEVSIYLDNLGFAASDQLRVRYSTDGGVTYKAGPTDYRYFIFNATTMAGGFTGGAGLCPGNAASGHYCSHRLTNLRAGRPDITGPVWATAGNSSHRTTAATFDGPVTHLQFSSVGTNNLNAGSIRMVGLLAA